MTALDMEDRRSLLVAIQAAPVGAVVDVGGWNAAKQADGSWHWVDDDDLGVGAHTVTGEHLSELTCCAHGAHYPRANPDVNPGSLVRTPQSGPVVMD